MVNNIFILLLIVVSGFACLEYCIPIAVGEFVAGIIGGLIFDLSLV